MGVVAWLAMRSVRDGDLRKVAITVTPITLVLAATLALMALHNARITGSPTQPPYLVYDAQYSSSPNLIGQHRPDTPVYRVAVMEQFYTSGVGFTKPPETLKEFAISTWKHSVSLIGFYAPWFIVPLLFVLPWAMRNAWMGLALACLATTGIALVLTLYTMQPHYAAPAAAAWTLLLVRAARYLAQFRWKRVMAGRNLVRLVFACLVASAMIQMAFSRVRLRGARESWPWRREAIERSLAASGRHLILVDYGPAHLADKEWVYNRADIDASTVVWARSLGAAEDARLRQYFAGRTEWRLHVDDDQGPFNLAPLEPMARNPEPETAGASR
jgi:hypothetical protein